MSSNPIYAHIGSRVHQRRIRLGMNQVDLGKKIGLSGKHVWKYETGAIGINAARLFFLGRVLDVPVSFFFEDMPRAKGFSEPPMAEFDRDPTNKRKTVKAIRAYYRTTDRDAKKFQGPSRTGDVAKYRGRAADSHSPGLPTSPA